AGWYKSDVTVKWTCADTLSGIASCPIDSTLTTEGATLSTAGTASDNAGNTATATVSGINIDKTAPDVTIKGITNGGVYTLGAVPTASCSATDSLSGVAGTCSGTLTGGTTNGVGSFSYTATATDKAGNTRIATATYKVVYGYGTTFFLQPINDTAHQTGVSTSVFKAGSTVPVKFQIKRADGTIVQANSAPQWLTPAKGSSTSAAVDESVYSDPASSGTTFKWDATAQQYIYNWSTKGVAANFYYRIGVTLDDGQTYFVNIGLR
ncbi:MAG TPA: PxKF domain-containing protein, partial [Herpetosiphonaceae bacterium]